MDALDTNLITVTTHTGTTTSRAGTITFASSLPPSPGGLAPAAHTSFSVFPLAPVPSPSRSLSLRVLSTGGRAGSGLLDIMATARPDHHMLDDKSERKKERERGHYSRDRYKKKIVEKAQAPPTRKRALEKEVVAAPKPGQGKVCIIFRVFLRSVFTFRR